MALPVPQGLGPVAGGGASASAAVATARCSVGLDPRVQLVVLSATVGHPEKFCQWANITRRVPLSAWQEAYEKREGDVKTVLVFED